MKTYKIGRNPNNDIIYDNLSVSGTHAELTIDDNGCIILIDHSTNGTYVNNEIIHNSAREITPADVITFPGDNILDWNLISIPTPKNAELQQPHSSIVFPSSPFEDLTCTYKSNLQVEEPLQFNKPSLNESDNKVVELSISNIISEGFKSGFRNWLSLLAIRILSILTIWIPYLNVGILIANCSLAPLWGSNVIVNPLDIFKSMYRKPMGEFAIMAVIMILVYTILLPFMIIPSFVIMFSWMLAPFMIVYKDMSANEALRSSNNCTYGHKWTIFFAGLLLGLISLAIIAILGIINYIIYENGIDSTIIIIIMSIINIMISLLLQSIQIGVKGAIWRILA